MIRPLARFILQIRKQSFYSDHLLNQEVPFVIYSISHQRMQRSFRSLKRSSNRQTKAGVLLAVILGQLFLFVWCGH